MDQAKQQKTQKNKAWGPTQDTRQSSRFAIDGLSIMEKAQNKKKAGNLYEPAN